MNYLQNRRRSIAFIKIKHSIASCLNSDHLSSVRQMIDNANGLIDKEEIIILKEYYHEAYDRIVPRYIDDIASVLGPNLQAKTA